MGSILQSLPALDVACALVVAGVPSVALAARAIVPRRAGLRTYERLESERASPLVPFRALRDGYEMLDAVGRGLVRAGVSPDAITIASLALACAGGALLGAGAFGAASLLLAVGSLGDALDGLVARATGRASPSGAVLDACLDRYAEMAVFAGAAWATRGTALGPCLVAAAAVGAFMTSYVSAKAEIYAAKIRRGSMRRLERAVVAVGATALASLAAAYRGGAGTLVLDVAFAGMAVGANVSAVRRLAELKRLLAARSAGRSSRAPAAVAPSAHRRADALASAPADDPAAGPLRA